MLLFSIPKEWASCGKINLPTAQNTTINSTIVSSRLKGRLAFFSHPFFTCPNSFASKKRMGTLRIKAMHPPIKKGETKPSTVPTALPTISKCCIAANSTMAKVRIPMIFFVDIFSTAPSLLWGYCGYYSVKCRRNPRDLALTCICCHLLVRYKRLGYIPILFVLFKSIFHLSIAKKISFAAFGTIKDVGCFLLSELRRCFV